MSDITVNKLHLTLTGGLTGCKHSIAASDIKEILPVPFKIHGKTFGAKVVVWRKSTPAGKPYEVNIYCRETVDEVRAMLGTQKPPAKKKGKAK